MGTTAEKLEYLAQTKADIKQAIINKGTPIANTDTFRSYAEKISAITPETQEVTVTAADAGGNDFAGRRQIHFQSYR